MKRSQIYLVILGLWLCLGANSLAQEPPPNFRIEFFTYPNVRTLSVRGANNLGVVVGHTTSTVNEGYQSFVVDQNGVIGDKEPGKMYLLADLINIPPEVTAEYANSQIFAINDSCQIIGHLRSDSLPRIPFFADLNHRESFIELPNPASEGSFWASDMNDRGDVLMDLPRSPTIHYIYNPLDPGTGPVLVTVPDPNDPLKNLTLEGRVTGFNNFRQMVGQLAGDARYSSWFLQTPGFELETFDVSHYINDINDSGQLCGYHRGLIGKEKRRNNQFHNVAYRYTDGTYLPIAGDLESRGDEINSSGDVVGRLLADSQHPVFVYHDDLGFFSVDDLVVAETAADLDFWNAATIGSRRINDRDTESDFRATETGFGQLFGTASISTTTDQVTTWERRIFILTPIAPPAPEPGITVTPTDDLFTTETGDTAEFTVVLNTAPMESVTIDISTGDITEGLIDDPDFGLVEFSSLTFTSDNWDSPQTVTVTGVDDEDVDGSVPYTIVTVPAISGDLDYDELDPEDVDVTNLDDEQAPMKTYDSSDTPTPIHDRGMTESTITINDDFTIVNMVVTLSITHQRPSDLDVFLVGPNDEVQLYNFDGPNDVSNFNGMSTDDSWTLKVYDTRKKKDGDLNSWSITVEIN